MELKDLVISTFNVRDQNKVGDSQELLDSIKEYSLVSKLILRPKEDKYEIIAGSRRYKALLSLHGPEFELPEDSYIIKESMDDKEAMLISIQENQQRKNLSPMELNRAALKLNNMGYKNNEIAKILNITPYRLKRIFSLSEDLNRIPDNAKEELSKPTDDSKFNDAHWDKIKKTDNEDVIKDLVDYVIEKESPPREIPTLMKSVEKQYEQDTDSSSQSTQSEAPENEGPMEYVHKGQLVLEKHGDNEILKVLGKGEDEEVPVEHYLQYLRYPEKFKCMVTFKLKVKPIS